MMITGQGLILNLVECFKFIFLKHKRAVKNVSIFGRSFILDAGSSFIRRQTGVYFYVVVDE